MKNIYQWIFSDCWDNYSFLPLWYVINYHNVKEENIDQYTLSRKYKIENKKFDYDKGGYMPK